jgi:hypothetical protein
MIADPKHFYTNADFALFATPEFASFLSTMLPNQDYGISMMKDVTGYANNIAWLIPPAKVPVAILNGAFTVADWGMKYHQSGEIPTTTILTDAAGYGLGKFGGSISKGTLGTIGEEVVSNAVSRGFNETSNSILRASKK